MLDIPVIRITEASLKYATLLGQTIGVVTMHERQAIIQYRRLIRRYSLDRFLSDKDPIRGVDITTEDVIAKGMNEPKLIVDAVRKTAEELADDGAEAIHIGCGLFGPLCSMAGLRSVKHGKVPLLDPILVGLKLAETMVSFRQALGTPFRSGLSCYEQIPTEDLNQIRKAYNLPPIK